MLRIADRYAFESDNEATALFALHRGHRTRDGLPVLAKLQRAEYPSPLELARMRHEHELLLSLQLPQVGRVLGLETFGNGLVLVLEDPGSVSLERLIRTGDLDLRARLEVAISLSALVASIHERQVVHNDVRPQHFYLDPAQPTQLTLIDMGRATRLAHATSSNATLAELEGSLPYIAPEQTGRLNRVIDRRADLYSLGATLYELFTGSVPFDASDPLELVHCHIARMPPLASDVNPAIPPVLGAIIHKLLAKAPEDRYQSAAGLVHDLKRCLTLLNATGTIAAFPIAERDASGELSIPQRLYGRERELTQIRELLALAHQGRSRLLLLTGYSGIGKSALVNELRRDLSRGGQLAAGKFDQLNRGVPYSALTQACSELVQALLAQPPRNLEADKRELSEALGQNGQVMLDLVPELRLVIGDQPPVAPLGAVEAQHRFAALFESFLRALARPERPLVLFLDDLQWADDASLKLIRLLLSGPTRHLLLIGAYRAREVDGSSPLGLLLEDLSRANAPVSALELAPLSKGDVGVLLADTLHTSPAEVSELAEVLIAKTQGNPFFLGEFLRALNRDGVLFFSHDQGRWRWDIELVRQRLATDNVVDFILARLRKLSAETQQALRLAACIGYQFDTRTLARVGGQAERQLQQRLWEALEAGLLIPADGNYRYARGGDDEPDSEVVTVTYRFPHDRVQQAAYALIDEAERPRVHLGIGGALLEACGGEPRDKQLFEIVDHQNRGRGLIVDPSERRTLARLNLDAARRASDAAALSAASTYARTALELLGPNAWETDPETTRGAQLIEAECRLSLGDHDACSQLLDELEVRCQTPLDYVPVRRLRLRVLLTTGDLAEACASSVDTLRLLGVDMPDPSDKAALGAAIGRELAAFQQALGERSIESLADLPVLDDPVQNAVLDVYFNTIPVAFQSNQELAVLIQLKGVQVPLLHGMGRLSPFFYCQYAITHIVMTGDYETAYRFGQLGVELAKRPIHLPAAPGAHFIFAGFVAHWRQHISVSLEHFRVGLRVCFEAGDRIHGSYCATISAVYRLLAGESLTELATSCQAFEEVLTRLGDVINLGFMRAPVRAIAALRGHSAHLASLSGGGFDEASFRRDAPPPVHPVIDTIVALLAALAGDFERTAAITEQATPLPAMFYGTTLKQLHALSLLELAAEAPEPERQKYVERAAPDIAQIALWASACPENHGHVYELLLAQQAALEGRLGDAMTHYDRGIDGARDNGYLHLQGLGNELCARFYLRRGRTKVARAYLEEAHYAYLRWGALGKVELLREQYPDLVVGLVRSPSGELARVGLREGAGQDISRGLDLATAIRATQAIATELVLETLIERLMRSLLENAGAQRGHFVLARQGELVLEASLTMDTAEVRTGLSQPLETTRELPSAVVQYVARTHLPLVLADASEDERFRVDPYVAAHAVRSILCVPMLHQGKLSGVLYLENNLTQGAFSNERAELLQLLAAQAAVAVENARLYADLNAVNARLTQANATLESQVAERTQELRKTLAELWSEMDLAHKIQRVLLPREISVPGYRIQPAMIAAESVGGDYYDSVHADGRHWLLIGDVSGHGVAAGLIMMMIQTAVRSVICATAAPELTPSRLLARVNAAVKSNLERISEDQYMTATALELSGPRVRYAGLHQDLLVHRAQSGSVERIETQGTWIGIVDDMQELLQDDELELSPGDTLLLFTDGLVEAKHEGEMLGVEGLSARFKALVERGLDPTALAKALLPPSTEAALADDASLIVVRYCP